MLQNNCYKDSVMLFIMIICIEYILVQDSRRDTVEQHQTEANDGVNILGRRQWNNIFNVIPMFDKYKYNLERQYNLVFNISKSGLLIVLVFHLSG